MGAATVAPAGQSRNTRGVPVEGSGRGAGGEGKANGAAPTDTSRAFKGGSSSGAGFGSSGSRTVAVDDQHHLHARRSSDAGQRSVGRRRVRGDRKGGGRRRSADVSPGQTVGAESNNSGLAKGGRAGRGKADGARTRPRQVAPQISFGGSGGDRRGGDRRGEAGDKAGRADNGTADNKFRMQAGQSNILVAVRLRPLLKHDREHVEVAKVIDKYRAGVTTAHTAVFG